MTVPAPYPQKAGDRTRWIRDRRRPRNPVDPFQPVQVLLEEERLETGEIATVGTIFFVHRECPWTCAMCDLWRNTTSVPAVSVPAQFDSALSHLPGATVLKLYNSGSFFDLGAIPKTDRDQIAARCRTFRHVIVESHPRLVGSDALRLRDQLHPAGLEVAMGLETCHSPALEKLNKRFTPEEFAAAAQFLRSNGISVRTFLLVGVPFVPAEEQRTWLENSIEFAFASGSNVVSLIPTRTGNGALEALNDLGEFHPPTLAELEQAQEFGIQLAGGRVFADTWDVARFGSCAVCTAARLERLHRINLSQQVEPAVQCACAA